MVKEEQTTEVSTSLKLERGGSYKCTLRTKLETLSGSHALITLVAPTLIMAPPQPLEAAQGQTLEYAGVLLEKPVFGHGQLYVALSRARSFDRIRVKILPNDNQGFRGGVAYTTNVVYRQVLLD